MARAAETSAASVSDLLSGVDLRDQGWSYTDMGGQGGFAIPPGGAVLFHTMLHGSARIACASGAAADLAAGDSVFVLSGEAHAVRVSPDSPVRAHPALRADSAADIPPTIALAADGPVCARMLSGRLQPSWPAEVSRASLPALLPIAKGGPGAAMLLAPDALARAGVGFGAAALLTRLAAALLVAGLRADPRCRQLFAPQRQDPIGEALRLIETAPAEGWTVEKLARAVGMGRSNFAAHFTQQVGRAPMELVAQQRMEHAADLLRQGRLKIAEISELAGYGSEAAFSRRFTRHFGLSPSRMRADARAAAADTSAACATASISLLGARGPAPPVPTAPPALGPTPAPVSRRSDGFAAIAILPGKRR